MKQELSSSVWPPCCGFTCPWLPRRIRTTWISRAPGTDLCRALSTLSTYFLKGSNGWKMVWRFLGKTKIYPMTQKFDSWVYGWRKKKNTNSKRYLHLSVYSSIIYSCQGMEAVWVSINRWMDEEDVVCAYSGILLSHKKWKFAICSNMRGVGRHCAKWNKSEKGRCWWYHLHVDSKKYNKLVKKTKQTDVEDKLVVTSVGRGQ